MTAHERRLCVGAQTRPSRRSAVVARRRVPRWKTQRRPRPSCRASGSEIRGESHRILKTTSLPNDPFPPASSSARPPRCLCSHQLSQPCKPCSRLRGVRELSDQHTADSPWQLHASPLRALCRHDSLLALAKNLVGPPTSGSCESLSLPIGFRGSDCGVPLPQRLRVLYPANYRPILYAHIINVLLVWYHSLRPSCLLGHVIQTCIIINYGRPPG